MRNIIYYIFDLWDVETEKNFVEGHMFYMYCKLTCIFDQPFQNDLVSFSVHPNFLRQNFPSA